jgi:hypothetical protein
MALLIVLEKSEDFRIGILILSLTEVESPIAMEASSFFILKPKIFSLSIAR